jgi:hypothetical protein
MPKGRHADSLRSRSGALRSVVMSALADVLLDRGRKYRLPPGERGYPDLLTSQRCLE